MTKQPTGEEVGLARQTKGITPHTSRIVCCQWSVPESDALLLIWPDRRLELCPIDLLSRKGGLLVPQMDEWHCPEES